MLEVVWTHGAGSTPESVCSESSFSNILQNSKKKKKKNHPDQAVPGPREATSSEKNSPMTMNLQQLFDPLNCGSVFF